MVQTVTCSNWEIATSTLGKIAYPWIPLSSVALKPANVFSIKSFNEIEVANSNDLKIYMWQCTIYLYVAFAHSVHKRHS